MIQARDEIVVLHGNGDPARQISIDGRTLPEHPEPSWMGTSAGHWEDDTLVVETTGFNERAWLDGFGHPRSESDAHHRTLSSPRLSATSIWK
jgi:hypothetical protein